MHFQADNSLKLHKYKQPRPLEAGLFVHVLGTCPCVLGVCHLGYRGHGCNTGTLNVWVVGTRRGVTAAIHRKRKRRNAVALVIGHMKSDGRLAINFLKGVEGDTGNALLGTTSARCSRS
jgi:hypothetical protein